MKMRQSDYYRTDEDNELHFGRFLGLMAAMAEYIVGAPRQLARIVGRGLGRTIGRKYKPVSSESLYQQYRRTR